MVQNIHGEAYVVLFTQPYTIWHHLYYFRYFTPTISGILLLPVLSNIPMIAMITKAATRA